MFLFSRCSKYTRKIVNKIHKACSIFILRFHFRLSFYLIHNCEIGFIAVGPGRCVHRHTHILRLISFKHCTLHYARCTMRVLWIHRICERSFLYKQHINVSYMYSLALIRIYYMYKNWLQLKTWFTHTQRDMSARTRLSLYLSLTMMYSRYKWQLKKMVKWIVWIASNKSDW